MMPGKLVADPTGYIFTCLVGYRALLGPIGGRMIADDIVVRRRWLDVLGLDRFDEQGRSRLAADPIALPFPETVR